MSTQEETLVLYSNIAGSKEEIKDTGGKIDNSGSEQIILCKNWVH